MGDKKVKGEHVTKRLAQERLVNQESQQQYVLACHSTHPGALDWQPLIPCDVCI